MSSMGVPSSMSTPRTRRMRPFRWISSTVVSPMGLDGEASEWQGLREDASRPRGGDKIETVRAIECPDHVQMGKPFDVLEALGELLQDLQMAFGVVLRAEAFGNLMRPRETSKRPRTWALRGSSFRWSSRWTR